MPSARRNRKFVTVTDLLPPDFVAEAGSEKSSNIAGIIFRFLVLKGISVQKVWFEFPDIRILSASQSDRSETGHTFILGDAGSYDWPAPHFEPLIVRLATMSIDESDTRKMLEAIYGRRTPMERLATAWDDDDEED